MQLTQTELKMVERALNSYINEPLHPTHKEEIAQLQRKIQFAKLGMEV
jgi:hypothetical protein